MDTISIREEVFELVKILGYSALFTELRMDKTTVPDGVYCYELRHGDDDSFPSALEESVGVNYFGTVLLTEKLDLGADGHLRVGYDDFGFIDDKMTMEEFINLFSKEDQEPIPFKDGRTLTAYLMLVFEMSIKEGDVLLKYFTDHKYAISCKNSLVKKDLSDKKGSWELCEIDDLIDLACDWNYELIQSTKDEIDNHIDAADASEKVKYYNDLIRDKEALDALFSRTKYANRGIRETVCKDSL